LCIRREKGEIVKERERRREECGALMFHSEKESLSERARGGGVAISVVH
jgi:hypothetical protein